MYSGSYDTDTCQSPECGSVLTASNSTSQGQTFQGLTKNYHGGKRYSMRRSTRRMRGGAVNYPSEFSEVLPADLHSGARITPLDNAFAQLPSFVGQYGMSGGKSRRSKKSKSRRSMRGGMAPVDAPTWFLTPQEEGQAFLNPQFYTENLVVPSFKGPDNSYVQKAGKRSKRKSHKNHKNHKSRR